MLSCSAEPFSPTLSAPLCFDGAGDLCSDVALRASEDVEARDFVLAAGVDIVMNVEYSLAPGQCQDLYHSNRAVSSRLLRRGCS